MTDIKDPSIIVTQDDTVYYVEDASFSEGHTSTVAAARSRPIYTWDTERGVGQLVAEGPGPNARFSDMTGPILINRVIAVYDLTQEVALKMRAAGWHRG